MNSLQFSLKKSRIITAIIVVLFFFFANNTKAQQNSTIPDEVLDAMLVRFRKIQSDRKAQIQYEKELSAIIDQAQQKLKKWLAEKQKEQESLSKNYKPGYKHSGADMNLFPVWEEIPSPVPSLPEAKMVNFTAKYQTYKEKVTMLKKQLSEMLTAHVGEQHIGKQEMINDSKAMADKNAMVQQMGGSEALMKMNEQERKQAALNAANQMKSNPGAVAGMKNPGMNAMAQRMMNDPAYREAYSKMTAAQKEAELKKYMGNTVEERNDKAFEASLRDRNSTYSAANVEILLGKCLQQMQEAARPFSEGTELANQFYSDIYKNLDAWYNKTYASLPETVTHEKKGLDILIKCKQTILYEFQKEEAATRTILWSLLKSNTKIAFGEFNDFIGSYQWGKSKNANLIDGKYTEPKVAQAVSGLYDEMIRMASDAELMTQRFKGQQEQYELIVNNKS